MNTTSQSKTFGKTWLGCVIDNSSFSADDCNNETINFATHKPKNNPIETHTMQAIETKLIPATNTKPTRIKASCERGSIIVSADSLSGDQANGSDSTHIKAAQLLVERFAKEDQKEYGTPIDKNPWMFPRVCGGTKQGYAHVFTA